MNFNCDQAAQVGQLWLEFFSRLASMTTAARPGSPPPEAARQIRTALLSALSEQLDQFMRSEGFLQAMKRNMDLSLDFQKQCQSMLTSMRHQTQGVAVQDIDAIMVMLRHMETRVLQKLDDLEERVADLAARMDEVEGRPAPSKERVAAARGQE